MAKIERVSDLDPKIFLTRHIAENRPVIVVDAMAGWAARTKWTPIFFAEEFGDLETQVYDSLFKLVDVCSLSNYLSRNFDQPDETICGEYVRWYAKFKDFDFLWSDDVFDRLMDDWSTPYFLPTTGFVLPCGGAAEVRRAEAHAFPYKGLFISGRGARTRLHKDPFETDAVLCQIYGEKIVRFYHPCDAANLSVNGVFVDPEAPDSELFPRFAEITPVFEDVLHPGEVLFIPGGWFHDVVSRTDSISITWNFAHDARRDAFLDAVADGSSAFDQDMIEFFFDRAGASIGSLDEVPAALQRLEMRQI